MNRWLLGVTAVQTTRELGKLRQAQTSLKEKKNIPPHWKFKCTPLLTNTLHPHKQWTGSLMRVRLYSITMCSVNRRHGDARKIFVL